MCLKLTRHEFVCPHIDPNNSYINIRKLGLPSNIMLTLFKLKNDLFLTEERKYHCMLTNSNSCTYCLRVDYLGHFILCTKSNIKQICSKLVEICLKIDNNTTAEKIVHMDLCGNNEEKFAIGWGLGIIGNYFFEIWQALK